MGRLARSLAAIGLLAGCGGGTTSPGSDTPIDFAFTDPVADTAVATANPGLVKAADLVGVSGQLSGDALDLKLEFAEPISPWSQGSADGLDGFVYFDVDQLAATGFSDPGHGIGVDFYLDLRDNGFGKVAVVDVAKHQITTLDATFGGTAFSVTIPLPKLSLTTDPNRGLGIAVVIGGRGRVPVADSAPNTITAIVVPNTP